MKHRLIQFLATLFVLLSIFACSDSGSAGSATGVSVTASKIRLLPDTSQPIRLEVRVDLTIANNGRRPVTFDGIVGEFFINDSRASATRSSLVRSRTIGPGEKASESIESMASNFGLYSDPKIRRKVEVSLLRDGGVAYGPFAITVPTDLRP